MVAFIYACRYPGEINDLYKKLCDMELQNTRLGNILRAAAQVLCLQHTSMTKGSSELHCCGKGGSRYAMCSVQCMRGMYS